MGGATLKCRGDSDFFKRIIASLHYLGLWSSSSSPGRYWHLVSRAVVLEEIYEASCNRGLDLLLNWHDLGVDDVCLNVVTCVMSSMGAVLFCSHIAQLPRAEELVAALRMRDSDLVRNEQREMLRRSKWVADALAMVAPCLLVVLAVGGVYDIPHLIAMKTTTFGGWYPYDVTSPPYLHVTVIVQAVIGAVFIPSLFAVAAFNAALLLRVEVQFRILHIELRGIRVRKRAAHARDWRMRRRLKRCVEQQQELLKVCHEIADLSSTFFCVLLICCFLPTTVGFLYCTLVQSLDLVTLVLGLGFVLSSLVLMSFCWLIDTISEQIENIKVAVYECDWLEASDSFKRSMRIIISNSNQPFGMKAAGFVPMTVQTFQTVMRTSYKYFTMLATLSKPKYNSMRI